MSSSQNLNSRHQQDLEYATAKIIPASCANSNMHNNVNVSNDIITSNLSKKFNNAEQPRKKRLKIEKLASTNGGRSTNFPSSSPSSPNVNNTTVDSTHLNLSVTSSATYTLKFPESANSPFLTPLSQLANEQNINHTLPIPNVNYHSHHPHNKEDNLMSSSTTINFSSSSIKSEDEVDHHSLPALLPLRAPPFNKRNHVNSLTSFQRQEDISGFMTCQDMQEFEDSLKKQCLCGISERMLRNHFQCHYSLDANSQQVVNKLSEWPIDKLLPFLSNLQLLFDIYFKQNSKGFICAAIKSVCDDLIRNDYNVIDEIIMLADYSNSYVQFLAGRVVASLLVAAKEKLNDNWLKKPLDNLLNFDRLDHKAVQKMFFNLEIIKRIIEWQDIDLHPLEEEIVQPQSTNDGLSSTSLATFRNMNSSSSVSNEIHLDYLHLQAQQPSLESNYFAVHYCSTESLDEPSSSGSSSALYNNHNILSNHHTNSPHSQHNFTSCHALQHHRTVVQQQGCHLISFSDSMGFDTTHLKCKTIKMLESKWTALVENMKSLIRNHLNVQNAENCILNFLQLWEKIISVKANLPVGETEHFYAQLDIELLLSQNISCTIYKQMLCLFNEALCYGSTLALQDILPNEICVLADQIVMYVIDSPLLEYLPRREPENLVGLIGFKGRPVNYTRNSLQHQCSDSDHEFSTCDAIKMDKTVMQKFVLLVLKSIAVKIKVIQFDSSDSSIDSTDYSDFQDIDLIDSIFAVLRKLESFVKQKLELLPHSHFSKIIINLFVDQDDHLVEAMVCALDVAVRISFLNNTLRELQSERLQELVTVLNPVYTFLEFLNSIRYSSDLPLSLLVSNETCFLLYLLRFLKYICKNLDNWENFVSSCRNFDAIAEIHQQEQSTLVEAMDVLICLRLKISHLVSRQLYPYNISPVLRLLENCESFYTGNELV